MKIVVLGANGNFGLKRLEAFSRSEDEIVGVCDLNFDKLDSAYPHLKALKTKRYEDFNSLEYDLAVVSLPDHIKSQVIRNLLAQGKHVLVEKPLSLDPTEVTDLFSLAKKNNCYLYVGYNIDFFPSVSKVMELTREKYFGNIHHVRLFYGHGGVGSLVGSENWRIGKLSWGGAFVDMGTHLLSLASHFMEEPEEGLIIPQHVFSKQVDDHTTVILRTKKCLIELTASWTSWRSQFSMEIYGEKGFAQAESLVKYVKYGQDGEKIRYGLRQVGGPPIMKEMRWMPQPHAKGSDQCVDPFTAQVEFLNVEWEWLKSQMMKGDFDRNLQEKKNKFIAQVHRRFFP